MMIKTAHVIPEKGAIFYTCVVALIVSTTLLKAKGSLAAISANTFRFNTILLRLRAGMNAE